LMFLKPLCPKVILSNTGLTSLEGSYRGKNSPNPRNTSQSGKGDGLQNALSTTWGGSLKFGLDGGKDAAGLLDSKNVRHWFPFLSRLR
jgi:hypothetical protein